MSRSKNSQHPLLALFILAQLPSLACNNHQSQEKSSSNAPSSEAKEKERMKKTIDEEDAKKLVLQSYQRVFSSLYFLNDIDQEYFHPPAVHKDELRASLSAPNSWRITNFPAAGTYFEARVDRNTGAVEWIKVGYATE